MTTIFVGPNSGGYLSDKVAISANGRFIAFHSYSVLSTQDKNAQLADIYLTDTVTGTTRMVSVSETGAVSNGSNLDPSISDDGRWVAFTSALTPVFSIGVKDMLTGKLINASTSSAGIAANAWSMGATLSADARFVVFASAATNLVADDTNGKTDIFMKDLASGVTTRVSTDGAGGQTTWSPGQAAISADGKTVVFDGGGMYVKNVLTGQVTDIAPDPKVFGYSYAPALSSDGRYVAFNTSGQYGPITPGEPNHLYWRDMATGAVKTIGDGLGAYRPSISGDGRFVTFWAGQQSNIYGETPSDIYLADVQAGTVTKVTQSPAHERSYGGAISRDGNWVAYLEDTALNVVPKGRTADVYRTQLSTSAQPPGDGTIKGSAGADKITGGAAGDRIAGGGGDDTIDGGGGVDTAVYAGSRASYSVSAGAASATVVDKTGVEGRDSLVNVERLHFADMDVAIDVAGAGGQAYRLYQATFDRAPDVGGLGFWMKVLDAGVKLSDVATEFMSSPEFKSMYGPNPSTADFIDQLYHHALHRAGEPGGVAFWTNVLARGDATQGQVLAAFSESVENQAALIGVIQNGMPYTLA
jgi:Tol biopolymer transport system component